jgi:predicted DNA-binding helix-hairpin-helix protein
VQWAINNMTSSPDVTPRRPPAAARSVSGRSARRIVVSRKNGRLGLCELKRLGVFFDSGQYFI